MGALPHQACAQMAFLGLKGRRGISWRPVGWEWTWPRPLAAPFLPNWPDHVGSPEALEACLVHAPLSVSHVVYDGTCTRDLCQLVPFQLEQDKNHPRPLSPESFEFSVSGSELTGTAEAAARPLCGWAVAPRPSPDPCLSPCPGFLLLTGTDTGTYRGKTRKGPGSDWPRPGSMLSAEQVTGGTGPWDEGRFL